jgi:gibberellin A4 carboxyl methyltransferase
MEKPFSVTTGMVGRGFYNRNSAPQMSSIDHVMPWLEDAIGSISFDDGVGALGLADFGCSEGGNSIAVMRRLIPLMRGRTNRHIQTIHCDLPTNDFASLFVGLRPNGRSVFGDGVSSCVVGGSMYDSLLPPNCLHIATCFNAIGFLSRRPIDRLPGYILPNGPSRIRALGTVSEAERTVFAEQASRDVESFLRARAIELVPGGKLLLQVFGAGDVRRCCDGIYDVLNDAVLEVLDDGMIDRAAYDAYYQPVFFRTLDELTDPVELYSLPFRIDQQATYETSVPFNEDFARSGNVEVYACEYTNFHRAFTEGVLRISFADSPELDRLVSEIYTRAERLVRDAPERYPFSYVAIAALMTRTGA